MKKIMFLAALLVCTSAVSVHADPKYAAEVLERKTAYSTHLAAPHTKEDAQNIAAEISAVLNSGDNISSNLFDMDMQKKISAYFSAAYKASQSASADGETTDNAYHCLAAVKTLVLSKAASVKLSERDQLSLYITASETLDNGIIADMDTYLRVDEMKKTFLKSISDADDAAALAKLSEWSLLSAEYYCTLLNKNAAPAFTDVSQSDWFYDAVSFVCANNVFKGTSDTEFEPHTYMTRAMFVTALLRMDESTAQGAAVPYTDVAAGEWYAEAVGRAYAAGYLSWADGAEFMPNAFITREEMVQTMYLFAKDRLGTDLEMKDISAFSDYADIAPDKTEAFVWAYSCAVVSGNTDSQLNPKGTAKRCEAAQIFMNFAKAK